jgi:hypothetical protein
MSENPWLTFALFVGICFSVAAIGSVWHRHQSGRGMWAALPGSNLAGLRGALLVSAVSHPCIDFPWHDASDCAQV